MGSKWRSITLRCSQFLHFQTSHHGLFHISPVGTVSCKTNGIAEVVYCSDTKAFWTTWIRNYTGLIKYTQ